MRSENLLPTKISPSSIQLGGELDALHALEWDRFLGLALSEARSEPGKKRITLLADPQNWSQTVPGAALSQQETSEVSALLDREALWGPLSGLADPSDVLDGLGRGLVLGLENLVEVRAWLHAVDSWTQLPREELGQKLIRKAIAALADPYECLKILNRILTPEGEISEKASPQLASLYSEIRALKKEIAATLDQVVRRLDQSGVLQEKFTDVREGRYVVPVRVSDQSKVEGIIYGTSASRQSVFIEPKEVEVVNHRLRQKETELSHEIYKVLLDTSTKLRPFAPELMGSVEVIAHWDAVQAKARLARKYGGKAIHVSQDRVFSLSQTAHPLLWWSLPESEIIRNELSFGEGGRALLLTGPNTGGKTVLLKTLGLAGLCARTGFLFPGMDRLRVPFFDSFFVDLGDQQSIERQLSSFSGHVLTLKRILEGVTSQSLVLLDELNSATDPQEGAALGRAFLETVISTGSDPASSPLIVATTHDPQLKSLGFSDPRILNASMEFDESRHTPTYRLAMGIPGRSRALETAERLGIPKSVLDLARSYLSAEHHQVDGWLSRLEQEVQQTGNARRQAVAVQEEAEKLRKEWLDRTRHTVQEAMDRTKAKLRQIVDLAQDEIRQAVRKLEETRTHRGLDQTRKLMNEVVTQAMERADLALTEEAPDVARVLEMDRPSQETAAAPRLEVGAWVRVPKWKSWGKIVEMKGNATRVMLGQPQPSGGLSTGLTVNLSISDVELLSRTEVESLTPKISKGPKKSGGIQFQAPESAVDETIDLRGIRYEEAMMRLEAYLDQALRSGRARITIIHGLGTGAIREGARAILSKLPYVKEYRDGGAGGGGAGATIVEFERS